MVGDFNAYQKQEGVLSQIRCPENYKLIRTGGAKKEDKKKQVFMDSKILHH